MENRHALTRFLSLCLLMALCLLMVGVGVGASSGREDPQADTVDGPEAVDLIKKVTGYVLMNEPGEGILVLSLPALQQVTVRAPDPQNDLHDFSGPDREGRIAYIDSQKLVPEKEGSHALRTIRLDGTDEQELFSRPGDDSWTIGRDLSLAPSGGRVALVNNLEIIYTRSVPTSLNVGPLEVWDVAKKAGRKTGITANDTGLSWFPDGKRLAYVEAMPKGQVTIPARLGDFGKTFRTWQYVPAVHILDTDTGKKTFLHVGWGPVVSSDGKTVLVQDYGVGWRLVDVAAGESKAVRLPGGVSHGPVALLDGKLVLYWAVRTTGTPVRHTLVNSPLSGPKEMLTLKLTDLETGKFQTVVPYLDPRRTVSFGPGRAPR